MSWGDLRFLLLQPLMISLFYTTFCARLVFTLPMSFTGSYTEDELNFPWQNNLILQKKDVWHRQGWEFQGLLTT